MPPALRSWPPSDRLLRLRQDAGLLAAAVVRVPAALRAAAFQDGLDLLAVIAGWKPLCLVGRGVADAAFAAALKEIAAAAALVAHEGAPWAPLAAPDTLPDWYLAATARRRAAAPLVLYLCADAAVARRVAALSVQGRIAAADEAAMLGYPPCCVMQHHRQALGLEALIAAGIARLAPDDLHRARLVEAGVEPAPAGEAEWRRRAELVAIAPASGTSVNMCAACAGGGDGPARRLARRYRALAAAARYPQPGT